MAEKQKVDYIGGKDPFYVANRLRGLSEEELDDFYSDATSGSGAKIGPQTTALGIPVGEKLSLRKPARAQYALGLRSRRDDYVADTAAFEDASQQLQDLVEREQQRRSTAATRDKPYDYYTYPTKATEAARLANQEEEMEYEKNRSIFTPFVNLFTGEGDRIKKDYYANREREMQLGELANQLYDIDIAGEPLPKELLNQFRNLGGEEYVPLSERTAYQRMLTDKEAPDEEETPLGAPAAPADEEKPVTPAATEPEAPYEPTVYYTPRDVAMSQEPESFVEAVDERVASASDEKPKAPASAEPANEEALAQWRETLKKDFVKIMGSEYDPNSSMDFDKMKLLADTKRENPTLSTNALALKLYRSGRL
jgi:hypothetical protein